MKEQRNCAAQEKEPEKSITQEELIKVKETSRAEVDRVSRLKKFRSAPGIELGPCVLMTPRCRT